MKRARMRSVMLGGVLALAGAVAMADDAAVNGSPVDQLLKMEGIDGSYAVGYFDIDGKAMTRTDFVAAVMHKHLSFNVDSNAAKHTASLRLFSPDSSAAKEFAAGTAAVVKMQSHMLAPGQPLPPFQLSDLDGHGVNNASLHGHVTLINFFFATCAPCIEETPVLAAYAKAHPGMHVMAVTFDDAKTARDYVAAHRFGWPVLADATGLVAAMGVSTYPTMALVGPDGRLLRIAFSSEIGGGPLTSVAMQRWVATGAMGKPAAPPASRVNASAAPARTAAPAG